jgi:hypothetical protein
MINGAELGTTSAPRRPFVPTQHVPRRHRLWRRAVLPRRHRLRRRVKGPKMTLKFFRVQTWIFFRWRTKIQKIRSHQHLGNADWRMGPPGRETPARLVPRWMDWAGECGKRKWAAGERSRPKRRSSLIFFFSSFLLSFQIPNSCIQLKFKLLF